MLLRRTPKCSDPLERLLRQSMYKTLPISLVEHSQAVPLGILVRGILEWLLDEKTLDHIFQEHAPEQYTRELTISTLVSLLIQVAAGLRSSAYAAYKADQSSLQPTITTSFQALYGKLGRMNPAVAEALVRHSATRLHPILQETPPARDDVLPGYCLRILDGNMLAGTDHRLTALRKWLNGCLPGKSLVVYEPASGLVTDLVLCEDAYTQERALVVELLPRVEANDLWVADRNFCTARFIFGVAAKLGFFVVRQHGQSVAWEAASKLKRCGKTDTGIVYEQRIRIRDPQSGAELFLRRIELRLFEKTRDGDRTLAVYTNLPDTVMAVVVVEIYRKRWTIETQFQFLTESLRCEVPGLGRPRAALFMFAMALLAGNALATIRGSLREAHGIEIEQEISGFYLADEMAHDYRTLMKYLPPDQWVGWQSLTAKNLQRLMVALAQSVNIAALTRSKRGPKRPPAVKPIYDKKHKHRSTARLLDEADDTC
jgi:hypothetical protein